MGKIGRNDPCPCGSGKKYKKCCIGRESDTNHYHFDTASVLHRRCIAENLITSESVNVDFNQLLDEAKPKLSIRNGRIENISIEDIKTLSLIVEEKIIELCSSFSTYELFFWMRRIKPVNKFGTRSAYSYHELMKVATFAFGRRSDIFAKVGEGDSAVATPRYLVGLEGRLALSCVIPKEVVSILTSLYQLEDYCFFYIHLANCSRVLIKGGLPQKDSTLGVVVNPSTPEIAQLIRYYDQRSETHSLLTTIGSYSVDSSAIHEEFDLVFLQYNFEDKVLPYLKAVQFIGPDTKSNFEVGTVNIHDFYSVIRLYNDVLKDRYGFESEVVLSVVLYFSNNLAGFLSTLMTEHGEKSDAQRALQLLQRGYSLLEDTEENRRQLVDEFRKTFARIFPTLKVPSVKSFLCAYEYLFFSFGQYGSLEHFLLKGFSLTKVTKDKILVDHTSAVIVLRNLLSSLRSLDGEHGNIASTDFENKTNSHIAAIYGKESILLRGEISSGTGKRKEIDASFVLGEFLFVIECKSLSVSDGTIFGDQGALEFRTNKLKEFMDDAEGKVDFIALHHETLSVTIPKAIKYIVPLVATSFPEYVWTYSDEYFITDRLTRFIILDDVKMFGEKNVLDLISRRPFVRRIKR